MAGGEILTGKATVSGVGGVCALAAAVVCAPPVLGRLVTADGHIDGLGLQFLAWGATLAAAGAGTAWLWLAARWSRSTAGSMTWRFAVLRAVAAAGGGAGAGLAAGAAFVGITAWHAGAPDGIDDLDAAHPDGVAVHAIRARDGAAAARTHLGERLRARAPAPLVPYHLWPIDPADACAARRRAVAGQLGGTMDAPAFAWRPGQPVPPVPDPALGFACERQVLLLPLVVGRCEPALDRAAADVAHAFVGEWRRTRVRFPEFRADTWGDDPMANRVFAHLAVQEARRALGLATATDELALLASMLQHGTALLDPALHNPTTNHGTMQDAALVRLALAYPEQAARARWLAAARTWTQAYAAHAVAPDGTSRELAPGYHGFVAAQLAWIALGMRHSGEPAPDLEATARRMVTFDAHLRTPDGGYPLIGDTGASGPNVAGWPWAQLPAWPELAGLQALGRGTPTTAALRLRSDAGYGLLRSPRSGRHGAVLATLMAGGPATAHGHQDKLAVTLFARGHRLLDGPGYPSFFDEAIRARQVAAPAHNSVTVDGVAPGGTATFERWDSVPGHAGPGALVRARRPDGDGIQVERTLAFGLGADALAWVDRVQARPPRPWRVHFRAGPGVRAVVAGDRVELADAVRGTVLGWVKVHAGRMDGPRFALAPGPDATVVCSIPAAVVQAVTLVRWDAQAWSGSGLAVAPDGAVTWRGPAMP